MKTDQPTDVETKEERVRRAEGSADSPLRMEDQSMEGGMSGSSRGDVPPEVARGLFSASDEQVLEIYMSGGYY